MPKTMLLTALVVEDMPHVRQQLVDFLANQPIFSLLIEAANATEANELLNVHINPMWFFWITTLAAAKRVLMCLGN